MILGKGKKKKGEDVATLMIRGQSGPLTKKKVFLPNLRLRGEERGTGIESHLVIRSVLFSGFVQHRMKKGERVELMKQKKGPVQSRGRVIIILPGGRRCPVLKNALVMKDKSKRLRGSRRSLIVTNASPLRGIDFAEGKTESVQSRAKLDDVALGSRESLSSAEKKDESSTRLCFTIDC